MCLSLFNGSMSRCYLVAVLRFVGLTIDLTVTSVVDMTIDLTFTFFSNPAIDLIITPLFI